MKSFSIDPAQFLVDTIHLTTEQVGAYILLLAAGAAKEGRPSENAARCITRIADWDAHRETLAAMFDVDEAGWAHPAIAEQIAERDRLDEFHKTRAAAGAAARHGSKKNDPALAGSVPKSKATGTTDDGSIPSGIADAPTLDDFANPAFQAEPEPPPHSLGTLLPPDFAMTGTMISEAKVKGVDDMALLADMFDEFKKYHINAGTMHTDWLASWDKWFERKRPKKPRAPARVQVSNKQQEPEKTTYEPDVPDDD